MNIFWHMMKGPCIIIQVQFSKHSCCTHLLWHYLPAHMPPAQRPWTHKKKALKRNMCVSLWTPLTSPHVTRSSRRKYPLLCSHSFYTHATVTSLRMIDIGVCAHEWLYPLHMCVLLSTPLSLLPSSWGLNISAVCAVVVGEGGVFCSFALSPACRPFYLYRLL